jgi:virginiamycin A acetyltransferase
MTIPAMDQLHAQSAIEPYLHVGEYTFGCHIDIRTWRAFVPEDDIWIGKFCSIADRTVMFTGGNHTYNRVSTYPFDKLFPGQCNISGCVYSKKGIRIGNDVWIGSGAVIMSGVTIGSGAVIGAYSVVRGDIPTYAVAIGNPCRVVKYRFDEERIKKLLEICWWDWPIEKIKENISWLEGGSI